MLPAPRAPALLLRDSLLPAERRGLGVAWVAVARSRCRLHWFALPQVPAHERATALRTQVLAWRPFENPAYVFQLQGEWGLAVAWDDKQARAQLTEAGLEPERCRVVPELTLRRMAVADGPCLVELAEGYEGRIWRDGFLRASRWWANRPDGGEWQDFVRAEPEGGSQLQPPDPDEIEGWLQRPAPQWLLPQVENRLLALERWVLWAMAAGLALYAGSVAAQWFMAYQAVELLGRKSEALRLELAPQLNQRDRALAAAAQTVPWAYWMQAPLPVDVIQYLSDALAPRGVLLREMELRGEVLRLSVQAPATLTRADLLKALQAGGWLTGLAEVRPEGAREGLWLEGRLRGPVPPSAALALPAAVTHSPDVPRANPEPVPRATGSANGVPPPKLIATKPAPAPIRPDEMPPASVFDAIK